VTPDGPNGEDLAALLEAAQSGERHALARLLSVVERGGAPARRLGRLVFDQGGSAYTVGVTGAPGAGKSTLVSRLVGEVRTRERAAVAVLAVDPTSPYTGGAILGDRVRMQEHALDPGVFIRSMASRGHLGGLAAAVPEAVRVLDAAGWPLVVVETVGVGQVEVEVAGTCDTTVVVVNPGWGDGIQANKAGLLEVADVFVVNKADRPGVRETRRDLEHMLRLSGELEWIPPIVSAVGTTGEGVGELWEAIRLHREHLETTGRLLGRRAARLEEEVRRIAAERVREAIEEWYRGEGRQGTRAALARREIDPYEAADLLLAGVAPALAPGRG
jgi:LAO/AO transport system kinase